MKKKTRIISAAAAALLAVAPVATSVVPNGSSVVQADSANTQIVSVVDKTGKALNSIPNNTYTTDLNLGRNDNSVNSVVNLILNDYKYKVANSSSLKELDRATVEAAVKSGLAGATVLDTQGNTLTAATNFPILITVSDGNNTPATLKINVIPYNAATDTSLNPTITYNNKKYNSSQTLTAADLNNAAFTNVAIDGTVNTAAIQSAFTATAAQSNLPLVVTVDTSKVNTKVGGQYPVTVSATDANTQHTVTLTFNIQVGVAGAKYQTAVSENNTDVPVYTIVGNTVSTSTTVKNGTQVPTFGTVNVGGVSYTRINSASSNQFILTSALKSKQTEQGQTETVMVTSNAYDKNGKYLGHKYYAYDSIDIVPTVVTINGKTYYKVADKDEYVRVINITGQQRKLKHNAYIYATSTRRNSNYKLVRKGTTVTTYGGPMKFRNGKNYYRIEGCRDNDKKYIKTVNFY